MKAITTITLTQDIREDFIEQAKQIQNSPSLMNSITGVIKEHIARIMAAEGDKVEVSIVYKED